MIVVRHVQLIGGQGAKGRIQSVGPSLRSQDGFSIVTVKVGDRVKKRLVSVRVGLRTDQRVVQSHRHLFEQGMGQIVDQEGRGGGGGGEIGAIGFLQCQLDLEFALTQIDVFRLWIDLKIDGRDARGERVDGHFATTGDAEIGGWDFKQFQGR